MTKWWNDTKWHFDKITVPKKTSWQHYLLTKWRADRITTLYNDLLMECLSTKMTVHLYGPRIFSFSDQTFPLNRMISSFLGTNQSCRPENLKYSNKKQQFNNNFEMKIVQRFVIISLLPEDIQKYFKEIIKLFCTIAKRVPSLTLT
jgi:hypothetical protein